MAQLRFPPRRLAPHDLTDAELLARILARKLNTSAALALAQTLLREFGSFGGVLGAPLGRLLAHSSAGAAQEIKLAEAIAQRHATSAIKTRRLIGNGEALLAYCQSMLRESPVEEFHLLFLNRKHQLLCDELHRRGTLDQVPAYPREIVRRALELNAGGVILVHNHPSGDPTPSKSDITLTREIAAALQMMDIALHDHLVIGQGDYVSLKAQGLLS